MTIPTIVLSLWMLVTPTLIDGRCSACLWMGQRSSIFYTGAGMTTLLYSPPFNDEDGKQHYHDPNSTSQGWTCSRGHAGVERTHSSCWCGWPRTGPYAVKK